MYFWQSLTLDSKSCDIAFRPCLASFPLRPSYQHRINLKLSSFFFPSLFLTNMRRSSRISQQSSQNTSQNPALTRLQGNSPTEKDSRVQPSHKKPTRKRPKSILPSDASDEDDADEYIEAEAPAPAPSFKKRKTTRPSKNGSSNPQVHTRLFGERACGQTVPDSCRLPARVHGMTYHRPLLLDSRQDRAALLSWFDGVSTARAMPWRKPWFDPADAYTVDASTACHRLERRAYEVWISEIMLQQTRVAVVIEYWNRWMKKWPTIQDLAAAEPEEVLAAWRGLGYYSRATRIHEAAKLLTSDAEMKGRMPASAAELQAKVPGVGRYTAGAISSIVFGQASPMVDGNVLRVLSRQLGLLGDVKTDKAVIDLLWAAADALVKAVARDLPEGEELDAHREPPASDRPGRWGQALMELGSTVCTPKPNCVTCPISSTCRAYTEGLQFSVRRGLAPDDRAPATIAPESIDIEDYCELCKPFEDGMGEEGPDVTSTVKRASKKQKSLQSFAFARKTQLQKPSRLGSNALEGIANYAKRFPVKTIKKAVREEETLVCAVRRSDGCYLIRKRPQKGLLAGLWEFPSHILPSTNDSTPKTRKRDASQHVAVQVGISTAKTKTSLASRMKHVGELGSVPWLFSHIKLMMHVHLFELDITQETPGLGTFESGSQCRWSDAIDDESMGTGMRKCWALVKQAAETDG